ncbi:MAG: inner membrane-spanning protein YciB [Pseudomonadales bacterium]
MNQLLDFLPIALFVAVFFSSDIYYATAALMAAVTLQVLVYLALRRPVGRELKITFWASMIFGGLTLAFRNELFIQWKPTIVNWILAVSLLASHVMGSENLTKRLLGKQLSLVDEVWARLNFGWAAGFFVAGALNLVVAYNFSMEVWVSYKLIGGFALTFLYIVITMVYLSRKGFLEQQPAMGKQTVDADDNARS